MPSESLYQGSKDVFLVKVRADFDALENQALTSANALSTYSLLGTEPLAETVFTEISGATSEGDRAVWRYVGTTGVEGQGRRAAGGVFPRTTFLRNYETEVYDPDEQDANEIKVPDERSDKEGTKYKTILDRAQKIMIKMNRTNIQDPFEVFNLAFTAAATQPTRFFVRGNSGLDGSKTALGERLVSVSHALANGSTAISNAVQSSGTSRAFSDDAYFSAREQGATFRDDVNEDAPRFGGGVTLMVPPANGLVRLAMEVNQSSDLVGSANNDINVHKGLFGRVISSPALLASRYVAGVANTRQFYLVDETTRDTEVGTGLVCIPFVPMETNTYRDESRDSICYNIKQTKVYGWVDWRNVIGSRGDGAAYSV